MPPGTPCRTSPAVRALLHERLDALIDESDIVSENAAYGQTLNDLEEFYLDKGRKFLTETFEQKIQERIEQAESDAELKQCVHCKKKRTTAPRKKKP